MIQLTTERRGFAFEERNGNRPEMDTNVEAHIYVDHIDGLSSSGRRTAERFTRAEAVVVGPLDVGRATDREACEECPRPVHVRAERVNTATGETRRDDAAGFIKACGTWTCPVCGPRKARRSVAHYTEAFKGLPAVSFVTLTLDPKTGLEEAHSRKYIIRAWSKWRKRINRKALKAGGVLSFVRAVEFHKSGQAHLHAVISAAGVSHEELAANWFEVGGGVVVDVQSLDGEPEETARRVGYCVKYAIKEAQAENAPRGRHYLESSDGMGYDSAPARARRAAYVKETLDQAGEMEGPEALPADEVRVYSIKVGAAARPTDPDTVTPEDEALFEALDMEARSTVYRTQRGGVWVEMRQHKDGRRTERPIPWYRSVYERRIEAAECARDAG